MRNRQKAVPLWKIYHIFTFFWPFPEFQDSGIPEFRIPDSGFWILEFWNSRILEMANLKAEVVSVFLPSNWPFPEPQNPGIPEFRIRIPEFRILEFWNSGILEFWNSGILEFWNSPNGPF